MADDPSKRAPEDASRISLSQDWEVRYWTQALGVSEQQLRAAIAATGNGADAVRKYLGKR